MKDYELLRKCLKNTLSSINNEIKQIQEEKNLDEYDKDNLDILNYLKNILK